MREEGRSTFVIGLVVLEGSFVHCAIGEDPFAGHELVLLPDSDELVG